MLLTYPLMAAIQEISERIGRVTGHGIAGNVCRNFPPPVIWSLVSLLFIANTINVAADLGAMADFVNLLIGGSRVLYVVAFGYVSVTAQIFLEYKRYVAILKWLTLALFALCHHASSREGAVGRSASRLAGAAGPVGRSVPDNTGCNFGNDDIAVSLHLAIIPGGGRAAHRPGKEAP
jgi:Mn2+/Fe2+ NRAMP family transporter